MNDRTSERIAKIEAVRRQLRTAIRMFFEDGDSVSIHTLTAAGHELLRGLLKLKGEGSFMKDSDVVRPDFRKEWVAAINRAQNFFKHADRDVDEVLEFNPEITTFLLFDCALMYHKLTGRFLRELWIFTGWVALIYPRFFKDGSVFDAVEELARETGGVPDKKLFLLFVKRTDLLASMD